MIGREEELLRQNEFFILRTARIATGRNITVYDDEWSIALSAFWEACQDHDPSKGSLQAYASVVIRHRLIDHARAQKRREREIPMEPSVFTGQAEAVPVTVQRSVARLTVGEMPEAVLAGEIDELAITLRHYGIDFFDLPGHCPKARKTRRVCLKAARFVGRVTERLLRLRKTRRLPAAEMEKGVPIALKLVEKFRKYIIASAEIEAGDYPGLQGYLARGEEA